MVVTKLYLKYCHMPFLQAFVYFGVKDHQHLSHEEAEKVKRWLLIHLTDMQRGATTLCLAIVEAGETDEEVCVPLHFIECHAKRISLFL